MNQTAPKIDRSSRRPKSQMWCASTQDTKVYAHTREEALMRYSELQKARSDLECIIRSCVQVNPRNIPK